MSILCDFEDNPITEQFLKNLGYHKINWGSPDYYATEQVHKKYHPVIRESRARWFETSYAWEKIVDSETIYYFPKGFNKYVNLEKHAKYPQEAMVVFKDWPGEPMVVDSITSTQIFLSSEVLAKEHIKKGTR